MRIAPNVSRLIHPSRSRLAIPLVLVLVALTGGAAVSQGQSTDLVIGLGGTVTAGDNGQIVAVTVTDGTANPMTAQAVLSLPSGVAYSSDDLGGGNTCDASTPGTVTCSGINVAAHNSTLFHVTVAATSAATGPILGDATSTDNQNGSFTADQTSLDVQTSADLTVTNAVADMGTFTVPSAVVAGNEVEYTISVLNGGPSDAQNVSLTDVFDGVQLTGSKVCEVVNVGDCSADADFALGDPSTLASAFTLAAGAKRTFKVRALLPHDAVDGNALDNKATATSDTADPHPGDEFANADTTIATEANLGLSETVAVPDASAYEVTDAQTATPHKVVAGDPNAYSYTLTVANDGPSDNAGGFDVTDTLPAGASFAGSSDNCSAPDNPQTVVCSDHSGIATTDPSKSFTFSVTTDSSVLPTNPYSDDATVAPATGATDDPSSANNNSSAPVNLITRADLTASVATQQIQTPAIYANGNATQNSVLFTFTFANNGPSDAQAIDVVNSIQQAGLIGSKYCFALDAATCTPTTTYSSGATYPTSDDLVLPNHPVALASGHSAVVVVKALADPTFRGLTDATRGQLSITDRATISSGSTTLYSTGDDSATSTAVKIDTAPLPPVAILTTPGDTQIGIEWLPTPDSKNGGTLITGYKVFETFVSAPPLIQCATPTNPVLSTGTTTNATTNLNGVSTPVFSYVIGGFTDGCTYSLTVKTTNAVDDSNASNALLATPTTVAKTIVIPTGGAVSLDTGFAGGAQNCDPSVTPNCKVIVSKYSLTDLGNTGSLTNLDTEVFPGAQPPPLCKKVDLNPASQTFGLQVQGDCEENLAVRSTYPTRSGTNVLTTLHLEYDQYDGSVTTLAEGAPCLAIQINPNGTIKFSTPPSGVEKEPICSNPAFPVNATTSSSTNNPAIPGTNLCDSEGEFNTNHTKFGWTSTHPCAYIYYEAMQIDGWDLHGTRPVSCTSGQFCGAPFVIGSSVQAGIQFVHTTPTPTYIVRPWCTGKLPNFTYIPCVFKYNWLNKSTGQGNNDIQVQTYTPQLDMLKSGGSG